MTEYREKRTSAAKPAEIASMRLISLASNPFSQERVDLP
tara:strand:+ start:333 stop:449 length:117 start_codon:yes stop_codon:yes gene_type:complete